MTSSTKPWLFLKAREIKAGDLLANTLDNGETNLRKVIKVEGLEMNTKKISFCKGEPEFLDAELTVGVIR